MSTDNNGGLVQIVNYGNQDLTLTGKPEISFFKSINKRYTNFGIKSYEIAFNNETNFGLTSTATIPHKTADLLSKLTLKIKLPKINLTKINNKYKKIINNINMTNTTTINNSNNEQFIYYSYLITFINKLKNIIDIFFKNNDSVGSISYITDLKNFIQKYLTNSSYIQFFTTVSYFFNKEIVTEQNYINTQLYTNASLFKTTNNNLIYIYENLNENFLLIQTWIH